MDEFNENESPSEDEPLDRMGLGGEPEEELLESLGLGGMDLDKMSDEEIGRALFGNIADLDEIEGKLIRLDQDRVNDTRLEWRAMYGFDHECSCATDVEEGKVRTVPACYLGAAADAFEELRRVRGFLFAIASSPSKEPEVLKLLAEEAFEGAR